MLFRAKDPEWNNAVFRFGKDLYTFQSGVFITEDPAVIEWLKSKEQLSYEPIKEQKDEVADKSTDGQKSKRKLSED